MGKANQLKSDSIKDESSRVDVAIKYQLMTPLTNYLVVHEREGDDLAAELPDLSIVPQPLAAGYGGMGSVKSHLVHSMSYFSDSLVCESKMMNMSIKPISKGSDGIHFSDDICFDYRESLHSDSITQNEDMDKFVNNLNQYLSGMTVKEVELLMMDDLTKRGITITVSDALFDLIKADFEENSVVLAFIYKLTQSKYKEEFDRGVLRTMLWIKKHRLHDEALFNAIELIISEFIDDTVEETIPF